MQSQKTKNSIATEGQSLPTTGIPDLDRHIDYLAAGSLTAAFVMLDIASKHSALGEAIKKRIQSQIDKYTDHAVIAKELERESEHGMEVSWWVGFWQGIQVGRDKTDSKAVA